MSDVEDAVDDFGDSISGVGEDFLNISTQLATGGLVGFEDGDFNEGVVGERVIQGFDRLTGRDIAEAQLEASREAVRRAEERARDQQAEAQELARRRDVQASSAAAAVRTRSRARGRGAQYNGSSLGDGEDLLGL